MKNFIKYSDSKDRIPLIMKRAKQGWTLTAIAKELEISVGALSRYCKDHKVDHGLNHRIKYDDVKILKLIKKKIPLAIIAERLRIPYHNLYAHCKIKRFDFIGKGW